MQKAKMGVLLIATGRFYHLGEETPQGSYHQRKSKEVREYMEAMEEFCTPVGLGRPAYTREDLAEALSLFQQEKVDCVFAAFLSWTEDFLWARFLRDVGPVPVLYAMRVQESIDFENTEDESDFVEFLSAGGLVGTLEGSGSVGRFRPEMFETAVGALPQLMDKAKSFCAAAAMRFDCPDDPQSVELLGKIQQEGPAAALAAYSGLKPENPLFGRILDVYRALAIV